jgi:hypothetical protein
MLYDNAEYKNRIAELSEEIQSLESELSLLKEQQYREDTGMEPISHDYPADTAREEHTAARWSDYDRARITSRIFLTGTYYGKDREFSTIRALFPERTEAAVKSMIYTLGGICKKGIVHPRIQPKQKENNA